MRVVPCYFHKINKIEPKEILSFFIPILLNILTQKLAIIETALYVISFLSQKLHFVMSQMKINWANQHMYMIIS